MYLLNNALSNYLEENSTCLILLSVQKCEEICTKKYEVTQCCVQDETLP